MILSPVLSEAFKGSLRQDGISILPPFALLPPHPHSFAIDIGNLQVCRFAYSESRGISDHQDGLVLEVRSYGKEGFNFGQIQNNGKLPLAFRILDRIDYPFALQGRS